MFILLNTRPQYRGGCPGAHFCICISQHATLSAATSRRKARWMTLTGTGLERFRKLLYSTCLFFVTSFGFLKPYIAEHFFRFFFHYLSCSSRIKSARVKHTHSHTSQLVMQDPAKYRLRPNTGQLTHTDTLKDRLTAMINSNGCL